MLAGGAQQVTNFVITDRQGATLLALPSGKDSSRQTYRVQRDHLQSVLAEVLPGDSVRYGFQALGFEAMDNRIRVIFTGGRHTEGDVVVGCDGVGSALRRQLIDDVPHFLGLSAITGDSALASEDPLLSGGYFMTLGDHGDSFFCYRQPGGVHFSYTSAVELSTLESMSQADLLHRVREATADWHPLIRSIAPPLEARQPPSARASVRTGAGGAAKLFTIEGALGRLRLRLGPWRGSWLCRSSGTAGCTTLIPASTTTASATESWCRPTQRSGGVRMGAQEWVP